VCRRLQGSAQKRKRGVRCLRRVHAAAALATHGVPAAGLPLERSCSSGGRFASRRGAPVRVAAQPLAVRAKPVSAARPGSLDPTADTDPRQSAEMRVRGDEQGGLGSPGRALPSRSHAHPAGQRGSLPVSGAAAGWSEWGRAGAAGSARRGCQWPSSSPRRRPRMSPLVAIFSPHWWPRISPPTD
jgi:hypothetical protein